MENITTDVPAPTESSGVVITPRNLGIDLVRVTEMTALAAGRWIGSGNYHAAHEAATEAMAEALEALPIKGTVVVGEEQRQGDYAPLRDGARFGSGEGPEVDLVVDPIDGTALLTDGRSGAISIVGMAPRGTIWSPAPALYMDKIVVDREAVSREISGDAVVVFEAGDGRYRQ